MSRQQPLSDVSMRIHLAIFIVGEMESTNCRQEWRFASGPIMARDTCSWLGMGLRKIKLSALCQLPYIHLNTC